jgi:ribosomal protein L15E
VIALFSFHADFFIYNYGGLVNIKRERQNGSKARGESSKGTISRGMKDGRKGSPSFQAGGLQILLG